MNNQPVTAADVVEIEAPASKSLSHRYLIGAALAKGESRVRHTLESADLEATRGILCQAGARMKPLHEKGSAEINGWQVWGMAGQPRGGEGEPLQCDVEESGTTCRLLTAVLAAGQGLFRIFGKGRMHDRPIGELNQILEKLGAGIAYEGKPGHPPFLLQAHGLKPAMIDGYTRIGMDDSSQYLSGLLLAAPLANSPLTLELAGRKAVSWPYVGLTLQCLWDFAIRFRVENRARLGDPWNLLQKNTWRNLKEARPGCLRIRVWPGEYQAGDYTVEGDWSGASYFLAAGALGKRPVRITGLKEDSLQGDRVMVDILRKMGAKVESTQDSVTIYPSSLHGVSLDMGGCPDLVPTVATLAVFAKGSTRIGNVAHLRLKESDRIAAPALELCKTGATVDALSDGLLINGLGGVTARNKPAVPRLAADAGLSSHNDHRIAMSLALLEMADVDLKVAERLDDPGVVRKSFPNFWQLWSRLR